MRIKLTTKEVSLSVEQYLNTIGVDTKNGTTIEFSTIRKDSEGNSVKGVIADIVIGETVTTDATISNVKPVTPLDADSSNEPDLEDRVELFN